MKKRVVRFCAIFVLAALLAAASPFSLKSAADEIPSYELKGIDYKRFTQKVDKYVSKYDVKLKLFDMEFPGVLKGSEGLTLQEMNRIILDVLRELDISLEDVELFSRVGENLDRDTKREIYKKIIVALSNYIPSPPHSPVSPSRIVKTVVYSEDEVTVEDLCGDTIKDKVMNKIQDGIKEDLADRAVKDAKWLAKSPKSGNLVAWFALSSIDVGLEFADTSQFERFIKEAERRFEAASKFYALCSQRMNTEVLRKNSDPVIEFKDATAENTCVFLGLDNVTVKYTLNGELVMQTSPDYVLSPDDNSGVYEGELTLVIEGKDFAKCFDARFFDQSELWTYGQRVNDWCQILYKFEGLANARENLLRKYMPKVNQPTQLKRTLVGNFKANVSSWTAGTLKPRLSGAFNNVSDTTEFIFEINVGQEYIAPMKDKATGADLGFPLMQWHVKSSGNGLDVFHVTWVGNAAARALDDGNSVGAVMYSGDGQDMVITSRDLGTVWYPLEYPPTIEITVPKSDKDK
ncbi:MAG: hypothetical protein J6X52_05425 [Clostridia bacterium]|nr:hypothetical protein [Clostridia bacterium]